MALRACARSNRGTFLTLQLGVGRQVELIFKRLKSIAQLGHLPKHHDQSSRAWLYGKLLIALLTQKLARLGNTLSPWGYLQPQEEANTQPLA